MLTFIKQKMTKTMKNIYPIVLILAVFFFACDPLEELKEDYTPTTEEFSYTLTEDDYATIADWIRYFADDAEDSSDADFIETNMYFTDDITSVNYVPYFLDREYAGKTNGTAINLTVSYNGEISGKLSDLINKDTYTISSSDYSKISSGLAYLNYFAPPYIPSDYIPAILTNNVKYEGDNDTVIVNYYYSENYAEVDLTNQVNSVMTELFDEGDLGDFTTVNEQGDQIWEYSANNDGSVKINGWNEVYYDNEDWLISRTIDLSDVTTTKMQIKHYVSHNENGEGLSVLISADYTENIDSAHWSIIATISIEDTDDEFVLSDPFDLSSYDGEKVNIAFRYISTSTGNASEWYISEVYVGDYGYKVTGGGDEYLVEDYYIFDSTKTKWSLMDNVYKLKEPDYTSLGLAESNFSSSNPSQDYLPQIADKLFLSAETEDIVYLAYDYSTGSKVITLADELTKTDTGWASSYGYIKDVVEPYKMTDGNWVFDPTVILTMQEDDYQIIVDYVNSVPELAELNSSTYDNSEYYYGASAYYEDYDIRSGSYYEGFDSWEEAVLESLLEGFLPNKYPNATQFSGGIEVFYYITFLTYNGANVLYTCVFGVDSNGSFYLVEGPTKTE